MKLPLQYPKCVDMNHFQQEGRLAVQIYLLVIQN